MHAVTCLGRMPCACYRQVASCPRCAHLDRHTPLGQLSLRRLQVREEAARRLSRKLLPKRAQKRTECLPTSLMAVRPMPARLAVRAAVRLKLAGTLWTTFDASD